MDTLKVNQTVPQSFDFNFKGAQYKHMKIYTFIFAFMIGISTLTLANDSAQQSLVKLEGEGLVYGKGHSFKIKAPKGWMLDLVAGKASGLDLVFYPQGSSWNASPVIYVFAALKDLEGQKTFDQYRKTAFDDLKSKNPKLTFKVLKDFKIGEKTAQIRKFEGSRQGNVEAAAYVDESHITSVMIFSSSSEKEFQKWYSSFNELVSSYSYLADNVKTEDQRK
jgi:hypothetical protein